MLPRLQFLGAAGCVTGSRYLLETTQQRLLIDCGLFQGYKYLREKNWQPFPVPPGAIDAVLLTHAHLDHSGYLPLLVAGGFKGPIYCTHATRDLCELLLMDAAKIQEEEAAYRNSQQLTRHHPARPLYTREMAARALAQLKPVPAEQSLSLGAIQAGFHFNGHILGSAYLTLSVAGTTLLFSGDLGRPHDPIMPAPQPPSACDYLVIESTYGDRCHKHVDAKTSIADIIMQTLARGGSLLIPAFAVGRAQTLLYLVCRLRTEGKIPCLPIYLDSPMALNTTQLLQRHLDLHKLSQSQCQHLMEDVYCVRTLTQSLALQHIEAPKIIISASGMASGGRVLHHLKVMLANPRNTVLFTGFQAAGTRGAQLVSAAPQVKIHGRYYAVKCRIENLDFLSAHADREEILHWLKQLPTPPRHTFITHGEPGAADQLRVLIQETLGWPASTPQIGDSFELV